MLIQYFELPVDKIYILCNALTTSEYLHNNRITTVNLF